MNIYEIDINNYWTGNIKYIEYASDKVEANWTRTIVPTLNEGEYAMWVGTWVVVNVPPPLAVSGDYLFNHILYTTTRLIKTQSIIAKIAAKGQK
jgi:hypothetical protein